MTFADLKCPVCKGKLTNAEGEIGPATDDELNTIAEKTYFPTCENGHNLSVSWSKDGPVHITAFPKHWRNP